MTIRISLILFFLFNAYCIWAVISDVFDPGSFISFFAAYDLELVYYLQNGVAFWLALAVIYSLIRQNEWGYSFSIFSIVFGIVGCLLITILMLVDREPLAQYMMEQALSDGSSYEEAEFTSSKPMMEVIMAVVLISTIVIELLFLWRIVRNKDYFSNSSLL